MKAQGPNSCRQGQLYAVASNRSVSKTPASFFGFGVASEIKRKLEVQEELARWKAAVLKAAKAIRTDADLTQAELASLLDLATCQVVNLERGHRAIRAAELLEIALVCGVTPRRLAAQIFFNFKHSPIASNDR